MNGIKKVFIGFIFTVISCVGFSIEAKAIDVELDWTDNDGNTLTTFNWDNATYLTGIMSVDPDSDFPTNPDTYVYTFVIKDSFDEYISENYKEYTVELTLESDSSTKSYKIKNDKGIIIGEGNISTSTPLPVIKIAKETVRTIVAGKIGGYGGKEYYAKAKKGTDPYITGNRTISLVKVTGGAYLGSTKFNKVFCGDVDITNGYYLFTDSSYGGETKIFTSSISDTQYDYNDWTATGYTFNSGDYEKNKAIVSAPYPPASAIDIMENFEYNGANASLNTVYVTNGKSISLSKFLSTGTDITPVSAELKTSDAVLDPSSTDFTSIGSISIKGNNSAGSSTDSALIITNADASSTTKTSKVVVYTDKPILTMTSGSSSGSGASSKFTVKMPYGVYYDSVMENNISTAVLVFKGKKDIKKVEVSLTTTDSSKLTNTGEKTITRKELTEIYRGICEKDEETVTVIAYPKISGSENTSIASNTIEIEVSKISFDKSAGASYQVDDTDIDDYFYGMRGASYKVTAKGTGSIDKNNSSSEFANITASNGVATISSYGVAGARTLKAAFTTSNSSSMPTPTPTSSRTAGEGMDDYDDVPKTGESKADIWILWSVLFVSILGAGFMIWKRFGLVRAIAEADEEVAVAEHKEEVKAKKKEKEDKIKMLKDLRNL